MTVPLGNGTARIGIFMLLSFGIPSAIFKSINEAVKAEVEKIVSKVNKELQPYARISKITMLEEPLEMTTTQKVKRGKIAEK